MHVPPVENRVTTGNIISISVGMATLLTLLGSVITNSNAVPNVAKQMNDNTAQLVAQKTEIDNLKAERADDRQEILGRLDRIEAKLDQKADKADQAKGWVR